MDNELIRIIITGSRDFNNYNYMSEKLSFYIGVMVKSFKKTKIEIITGKSRKIDMLARQFANENNFKLIIIDADYDKHGERANIIQNKEMVNYVTKADKSYLIAFWNGESKGTYNIINEANKLKLATLIFIYNEELYQ